MSKPTEKEDATHQTDGLPKQTKRSRSPTKGSPDKTKRSRSPTKGSADKTKGSQSPTKGSADHDQIVIGATVAVEGPGQSERNPILCVSEAPPVEVNVSTDQVAQVSLDQRYSIQHQIEEQSKGSTDSVKSEDDKAYDVTANVIVVTPSDSQAQGKEYLIFCFIK